MDNSTSGATSVATEEESGLQATAPVSTEDLPIPTQDHQLMQALAPTTPTEEEGTKAGVAVAVEEATGDKVTGAEADLGLPMSA